MYSYKEIFIDTCKKLNKEIDDLNDQLTRKDLSNDSRLFLTFTLNHSLVIYNYLISLYNKEFGIKES